jgi:uncharacterized membrane protein
MLQCPRCSASLPDQALFCPSCGGVVSHDGVIAEVKASGLGVTTEQPQSEDKTHVASMGNTSGEALPIPENLAGVVAYITIFPAIIFLFLEPFKHNFFVRFHAFQHLFLWVAGFVIGIAVGILGTLLQLIPFMRVLMFPLAGLISLAWFFLWVLLVVKAYHHELFKLPIIGDLAEQRASA